MRVTKYPQSCLVIEEGGRRILIDPGTITTGAGYGADELGDVEAVLFTHRHPDHCDPDLVPQLRERGIAVYGNADVADLLGGEVTVVEDGATFDVAGFEVTARDLQHVELVDGSPGPPNTGYLIDGSLFHPGDGIELPGLSVRHLALPIAGPSISYRRSYLFTESTGAEKVVPMHFDMFPADPELFARFCDIAEVVILGHGESADL